MSIFSRILRPITDGSPESGFTRKQRYAYLQKMFITVVAVAIVLPLAVTTSLSFYQYRSLYQSENADKLRLDALSAKQSFEFHIEESLSTMAVVAQGYRYGDLFSQEALQTLFLRLRSEYWWVVDLGALDQDGVQRAYVGPYPFQGVNYSDQEWFQNGLARQTYVSDIFTGHRGVPHFVVTATNGVPGTADFWMLRASIDSEHLASYITTINTDSSTDMFLVGPDGTLRTQSAGHGRIGDTYDQDLTMAGSNVAVTERDVNGAPREVAYAKLDGMPWTLVMERPGYIFGENWNTFQLQFIAIVFGCALVGFYIVYRSTRSMVRMIREAEERRDEMLAETEHTAKLASVGQLAAGVAHEINNPLAIINEKIGLMRDLTQNAGDFEQRQRFLELTRGAAEAVERCKDITHRLLGFARRMEVRKESLLINDVIREVISFVEKEALYRNIKLEVALDDGLPPIQSDRGQMQQIFLNIVNNAIDAVGRDGTIRVRTMLKQPGVVRATVTDTGPGIPPHIIKHVFEPFFTTKARSETSGTGLGLSITYGIVRKLCGRISVESPPGGGATFTVDFPVECDLEE